MSFLGALDFGVGFAGGVALGAAFPFFAGGVGFFAGFCLCFCVLAMNDTRGATTAVTTRQ